MPGNDGGLIGLVFISSQITVSSVSCQFVRCLQLVLPAGQVEIITTGHLEDFDDAALIPREDVEVINRLILVTICLH